MSNEAIVKVSCVLFLLAVLAFAAIRDAAGAAERQWDKAVCSWDSGLCKWNDAERDRFAHCLAETGYTEPNTTYNERLRRCSP
jgi:hypothetical protein